MGCSIFASNLSAPWGGQAFRGAQRADMKTKSKIWLGVGAFVVAGTGAVSAGGSSPAQTPLLAGLSTARGAITDTAIPRAPAGGFVLAQHAECHEQRVTQRA